MNNDARISVLLKRDTSQSDIAKLIGSSQSAVSRDKKELWAKGVFPQAEAHHKATQRKRNASSNYTKLTPEVVAFIESKLKLQSSPEQISGRMEAMGGVKVSHERIFQYIWLDKRNGGTLYKNLRRTGKKYNKRRNKLAGRGVIPNRVGIEERPAIVETKERIGDFE